MFQVNAVGAHEQGPVKLNHVSRYTFLDLEQQDSQSKYGLLWVEELLILGEALIGLGKALVGLELGTAPLGFRVRGSRGGSRVWKEGGHLAEKQLKTKKKKKRSQQ